MKNNKRETEIRRRAVYKDGQKGVWWPKVKSEQLYADNPFNSTWLVEIVAVEEAEIELEQFTPVSEIKTIKKQENHNDGLG